MQLMKCLFCLRNVLLGPPHDVQSEGVDPCRKFLLCLDKRNFFPCIQVLDHHAGQDFLFEGSARVYVR